MRLAFILRCAIFQIQPELRVLYALVYLVQISQNSFANSFGHRCTFGPQRGVESSFRLLIQLEGDDGDFLFGSHSWHQGNTVVPASWRLEVIR